MQRAIFVFVVKLHFQRDAVAYFCFGCLADMSMQVEIKVAVPDGHHINTPRHIRLAIHADADGQGPAPIFFDARGVLGGDQHVGIDFVDLDDGAETQEARALVNCHNIGSISAIIHKKAGNNPSRATTR